MTDAVGMADPNSSVVEGAPRILVAEDDCEMRALLCWNLRDAGYFVHAVENGLDLCRDLVPQLVGENDKPFDLVISDVRMPGVDGLGVLEGMGHFPNRPPVILITAFGDDRLHQKATTLGAMVIDKPLDFDDLVATVLSIVPVDISPAD